MVLPPSILCRLLGMFPIDLPHPLAFEVKHETSGLIAHAGVLEFSADEELALIPTHVMDAMAAEGGDRVLLTPLTDLVPLTFAQFQPLDPGLEQVTDARATLEQALRYFTVLNVGAVIPLQLSSQLCVRLKVTQLEPVTLGTLVDAELKVDFLPLEQHAAARPLEHDVLPCGMGDVITAAGLYQFNLVKETNVDIHGRSGTLYAAVGRTASAENHDWAVLVEGEHIFRKLSPGNVSLLIEGSPVHLVVGLRHHEPPTSIIDPTLPNCPHCGVGVPSSTIDLHTTRCGRINSRCGQCGRNMPKLNPHVHCVTCGDATHDMERHQAIVHAQVVCKPCGVSVDASQMLVHQGVCASRHISCVYCNAMVSRLDQEKHEERCGSMTQSCELCGKVVTRRRARTHAVLMHNQWGTKN